MNFKFTGKIEISSKFVTICERMFNSIKTKQYYKCLSKVLYRQRIKIPPKEIFGGSNRYYQ